MCGTLQYQREITAPTITNPRVPTTPSDLSLCPTIIPFSSILPPRGDNISYSHSKLRRIATSAPKPAAGPQDRSLISPVETGVPLACNVSPKMVLCPPTHGYPGINQARWLDATAMNVQTIPKLQYLMRLVPAAQPRRLPHAANSSTPAMMGLMMKGPDAEQRMEAAAEEFDRLLMTTTTMHFIRHVDKPQQPAVLIKNGSDKRIRGTYGGDRIDRSTNTASMETVMVLLNTKVSERGAQFTTADIKNIFLMSDDLLERPEYMWIPLSQTAARIQCLQCRCIRC
eukprot:gene34162-44134_t